MDGLHSERIGTKKELQNPLVDIESSDPSLTYMQTTQSLTLYHNLFIIR